MHTTRDITTFSTKFGWGKFRPFCLQWLNNAKWLMVFLSAYYLSMNVMLNGTYAVSISTVEKRFGLSSSTSGIITSMYDVSCLLVTTFVSYYGGQQSKARWLGAGLLLLALGNFIFIIPHFLVGPYQPGERQALFPPLCNLNSTNVTHPDACDSTTSAGQWYYAALFCIGMLVIGLGGSPLYVLGVTYLDESVRKKVSAIYVGLFSAAAIVGAALGFVIGGALLSTNVDLGKRTPLTPSDPRWIGNWWFGSAIVVIASLLLCPGMFGFPRVVRGAPQGNEEPKEEDAKDDLDVIEARRIHVTSIKDLLASTKTLFTSPSYVFISIGISTVYFEVSASVAFLPKVIQVMYSISPARVSLLYGVAIVVPVLLGQIIGSYIVKRLRLGAAGALKTVCIAMLTGLIVDAFFVVTACENPEILGATNEFGNSSFQAVTGCGVPCNCQQWPYYPVCDGNATFWSPCHARCSSYLAPEKVFQGCSCTVSQSSVVKPGKCPVDCGGKLALFLLIVALSGFTLFFIQTPVIIAVLRSVPYHLRSYAMGWQLNLTRIMGSIPGPIIYGKLIDTVCVKWQKTCKGRGSCHEYDHWKLLLLVIIASVLLKTIALLSFFFAWKSLRKQSRQAAALANSQKLVLESLTNNEKPPSLDKEL